MRSAPACRGDASLERPRRPATRPGQAASDAGEEGTSGDAR